MTLTRLKALVYGDTVVDVFEEKRWNVVGWRPNTMQTGKYVVEVKSGDGSHRMYHREDLRICT